MALEPAAGGQSPAPAKRERMNPWYFTGYTLWKFLAKILFRFRVVHQERIPLTGGVILAMNHQSYIDPPLAGVTARRPIYFLARKTLLDWPVMGRIFPKVNVIPVDQERGDMSALKNLVRLLKNGKGVIVFPEGARTLNGELQTAQPGVGLIIAKTRVPVVPMRIFGAREALPRGSSRLRFTRVTVVVGEPIIFSEEEVKGAGRAEYQQFSERVMAAIARLELE